MKADPLVFVQPFVSFFDTTSAGHFEVTQRVAFLGAVSLYDLKYLQNKALKLKKKGFLKENYACEI